MALTYQQIVTNALQICKAPGFRTQAGQLLNGIMTDLAEKYDFDIMKCTDFSLTTGSNTPAFGPYALPVDYLRACPMEQRFLILGQPIVMVQMPLSEIQALFVGQSINNYPTYFGTDFSTQISLGYPTAYLWTPPSGVYEIFWHYFRAHTDVASPDTSTAIPWFPSSNYLTTKLASEIMMLTDDTRQPAFEEKARRELDHYLIMKDDKEGYAMQVQLDRRAFPSRQNLKATKNTVW